MRDARHHDQRTKQAAVRCPVCGTDVHDPARGRSVPQLRRYMQVMNQAYYHWPEAHRFTPKDMDHLRKWLQMMAGYRKELWRGHMAGPVRAMIIELTQAILKASDDRAQRDHEQVTWVEPIGTQVAIWRSVSVSFRSMSHSEFTKLVRDVEQVIHDEIGITAEQLLEEERQAVR